MIRLATVFSGIGAVEQALEKDKIDYEIVSSNTWKSTLGIKGRARAEQKRNAQQYVLDTYGVKAIQDTCDAICIGAHIIQKEGFNWSD